MMKKVFYALALLFLMVAITGCQKASTPKIVSTREKIDGFCGTIVEATFDNNKQLYFRLLPDNTAAVTNAYCFSPEAEYNWNCYGDMVIPSEFSHNSQIYSVVRIDGEAFGTCNKLESIVIPNSVTYIGEAAFLYCRSLKTINIPDDIRFIECRTFEGCEVMESVQLPKNVEKVHGSAFKDCIHLTSIDLGMVRSIGPYAFSGCKNLTAINMPPVINVSEGAFQNCIGLQSIDLPASIEHLYRGAFSGCSSLTTVICRPSSPPITNYFGEPAGDPFPGCPIQEIKVPMESVSNYQHTLGWEKYYDKFVGF